MKHVSFRIFTDVYREENNSSAIFCTFHLLRPVRCQLKNHNFKDSEKASYKPPKKYTLCKLLHFSK